MNKIFTAKQEEEIKALKNNCLKRINIYDGSVRSGKTWISGVVWALWVSMQRQDSKFLMVGKTITSLKRNVLDLMIQILGEQNMTYNISQKQAAVFGKKVYLEGANDVKSESKIRGMTLLGAYCDELTLFPEDFFKMLLTRLSEKGAKLIATTNPDSPMHWLMVNYLKTAEEKNLDLRHVKFTIDDNTFLDKKYVQEIKKEHSGVLYERFILGNWKNAEGLIYDMFSEEKHVVKTQDRKYTKYYASCDYGTQNPTVFGLWGKCEKVWYKVKEYYYCGREKSKQKTDREFADDYLSFADGLNIAAVIVDPSAASFIAELKQRGIRVLQADNAVLDGIRLTSSLLEKEIIKINDSCINTITEFNTYIWDAKQSSKGVDKRPLYGRNKVFLQYNTKRKTKN